jgi:hypothetical protein
MNVKKLLFCPETGTIEDYSQCVVVLVPDDRFDDYDRLEEALNNPVEDFEFETQRLCTWEDIVDSFLLAMMAEGLDHDTRARIVTTVRDGLDNNDA